MKGFILFLSYIVVTATLFRYGVKVGWDHDPGILGPVIITFNLNLMLALYTYAKNPE